MIYPPRIGDIAVLLVQQPCHERTLLVAMLRDGGLRTIGLANGVLPAALRIRRLRPDVILVDLDSVGSGGLALAGGLDELAGGPPPVVAMKRAPTATFVVQAHALGVAAVLAKPYTRAALWRRIADLRPTRPSELAEPSPVR
jgi:CheY-like chemotaxis protein